MAAPVLTYTREPATGGDNGAWAPYLIAQTRAGGLGALSLELYNNGGALNMREGFAGIDDGVTRGVIECTTDGDIDTAGMTANCWHQVELSIVGIAPTLTIAAIAGATDESLIPATVKAAYDASKQGYYMTASKRLVGVVFLRAALALGRVVNCEHGKRGFKNIDMVFHYDYDTSTQSIKYIAKHIENKIIDMTALAIEPRIYMLYCPNNSILARIISFIGYITNNAGTESRMIGFAESSDCVPEASFRYTYTSSNQIRTVLFRIAGGAFDAAGYNAASVKIEMKYET